MIKKRKGSYGRPRIHNYLPTEYFGLSGRFRGLVHRCDNPKSIWYKNYGARGIKVEWSSYEDFRKDMLESFLSHVKKYGIKNTTLDRIDNDGNYSKENCRWITWEIQRSNRSKKYKVRQFDMGEVKNTKTERNLDIYSLRNDGMCTYESIGRKYNLTRQTVGQICRNFYDSLSPDIIRNLT